MEVFPLVVSTAFGPTMRFPWTVFETRTPLPSSFGHWNITLDTLLPSLLSSRKYSPAVGLTENSLSPTSPLICPLAVDHQFALFCSRHRVIGLRRTETALFA